MIDFSGFIPWLFAAGIIFSIISLGLAIILAIELINQRKHAALNDWKRISSNPGYVPDFIAPGEKAEIVETQAILNLNLTLARDPIYPREAEFKTLKCVGCRYAGRYLLPAKDAVRELGGVE